jgi:hypothetical protein
LWSKNQSKRKRKGINDNSGASEALKKEKGFYRSKKMYSKKNITLALVTFMAIIVLAGCSQMGYVNPRQVTIEDIISMTNQGVGKDIIIQHINSTHSRYRLNAEDVVKLNQAKVDPDVIKAMLQTENKSYHNPYYNDYGYSPWGYPYWGYPDYYYYYYWYDYPRYYNYRPYYYPYNYRGEEGRRDDGYRGNEQRGNEDRGNRGGQEQRGGGEQRGGMERKNK